MGLVQRLIGATTGRRDWGICGRWLAMSRPSGALRRASQRYGPPDVGPWLGSVPSLRPRRTSPWLSRPLPPRSARLRKIRSCCSNPPSAEEIESCSAPPAGRCVAPGLSSPMGRRRSPCWKRRRSQRYNSACNSDVGRSICYKDTRQWFSYGVLERLIRFGKVHKETTAVTT